MVLKQEIIDRKVSTFFLKSGLFSLSESEEFTVPVVSMMSIFGNPMSTPIGIGYSKDFLAQLFMSSMRKVHVEDRLSGKRSWKYEILDKQVEYLIGIHELLSSTHQNNEISVVNVKGGGVFTSIVAESIYRYITTPNSFGEKYTMELIKAAREKLIVDVTTT
jgi:hypothetical protein